MVCESRLARPVLGLSRRAMSLSARVHRVAVLPISESAFAWVISIFLNIFENLIYFRKQTTFLTRVPLVAQQLSTSPSTSTPVTQATLVSVQRPLQNSGRLKSVPYTTSSQRPSSNFWKQNSARLVFTPLLLVVELHSSPRYGRSLPPGGLFNK